MLLENELTEKIIGAAIEVHRYWGPGLWEEIYEKSLCRELEISGINYARQLPLPLDYKGIKLAEDLKLDVFVEGKVVVENKHVEKLLPVHEAQLLTYMKLVKARVGLLINYKTTVLKNGIKRMVL